MGVLVTKYIEKVKKDEGGTHIRHKIQGMRWEMAVKDKVYDIEGPFCPFKNYLHQEP